MTPETTDPTAAEDQTVRVLVGSFVLGGLFVIGVAVYLGAAVSSALYAVALVSLIDFALAWAFATGRIGPLARRRADAEATGGAAAEAELDPSYNPYARED
jgi:hypothetical protein